MDSLGVYLSRIFLGFLLKLVYRIIVGKNFQICGVKMLENTFASQKLDLFFFTHAPKQTLLRFLSSPPRQKEITHFPQAAFFENLFPPCRKGGGEENMELKNHHLSNLHIFGVCFVLP